MVDTSVWIDFFGGRDGPEVERLRALLENEGDVVTCGVILTEIFQGIRERGLRDELKPRLLALRYAAPVEPDSYLDAATLFRKLRARGVTVRSTVDCLIAILAAENEARILAQDRDFQRIVDSGLLPLASA